MSIRITLSTTGHTFPLSVLPSNTIGTVIAKIVARKQLAPDQPLWLVADGRSMEDQTRTLANYGVTTTGSRLLLALHRCHLPISAGPCKAAFVQFAYNLATKQCGPFVYGGCGGTQNRFDTLQACETQCSVVTTTATTKTTTASTTTTTIAVSTSAPTTGSNLPNPRSTAK